LWAPKIQITPDGGDKITLKLKDILENLDMIFFGDIEMRKGDWSLGLDSIYMNLGGSQTMTGEIIGRPQELKADVDMRAYIGTLTAGHTIARSQRNRFDIIGGARYLYIKTGLEFDLEATPGEKEKTLGGHQWDFLLGFEGKTLINDQWYFDYYGDVGSGASRLTWQAKVGMGYEFNKWTGTFGFRYLRYDFDNSSNLKNLDVIGPYFGAKWSW
ncbi:MAG: hypothetical protein OET41_03030, partial [Xanthomonadales bacterium]|nr:hypothetical protein [Xanthomonadales bacterium]